MELKRVTQPASGLGELFLLLPFGFWIDPILVGQRKELSSRKTLCVLV